MGQLVGKSPMVPRIGGLIPCFSWPHVEVTLDMHIALTCVYLCRWAPPCLWWTLRAWGHQLTSSSNSKSYRSVDDCFFFTNIILTGLCLHLTHHILNDGTRQVPLRSDCSVLQVSGVCSSPVISSSSTKMSWLSVLTLGFRVQLHDERLSIIDRDNRLLASRLAEIVGSKGLVDHRNQYHLRRWELRQEHETPTISQQNILIRDILSTFVLSCDMLSVFSN